MSHGHAPGLNPWSIIVVIAVTAVIALVHFLHKRWEKP